jgi:hypothetical protein
MIDALKRFCFGDKQESIAPPTTSRSAGYVSSTSDDFDDYMYDDELKKAGFKKKSVVVFLNAYDITSKAEPNTIDLFMMDGEIFNRDDAVTLVREARKQSKLKKVKV